MKKVALFFCGIIIIVAITIATMFINKYSASKTYYLKITNPGVETKEKISDTSIKPYEYTEDAYDENGNKITVKFYSYIDRALRNDAYLSILYQKKHGVVEYKEIKETEIPRKALEKIQKVSK